jgi:uncharacterized protein YgiM (DUF1202 family)
MKRFLTMLLALALTASLLAGCSSSSGPAVEAKAFSTGDVLSFHVQTALNNGDSISYGGYQFESAKTLAQMTDLIKKANKGVTAESYDNAYGPCTLFTKDASGVKDTWCLYQQDPTNVKNQYIFVGTHREVQLSSGNVDILLPLQLVADSYIRDSMANRLKPDTAYACGVKDSKSTMAELFQTFYQDSGLYTVTAGESGGFTIADKNGGDELTFSFQESSSGSFFTISTKAGQTTASQTASVSVVWSKASSTDPVKLPDNDALIMKGILTTALGTDSAAAGTTDTTQASGTDTQTADTAAQTAAPAQTGANTAAFSYDYAFTVDDDNTYKAAILWSNNAWTASVKHGDAEAALDGKNAAALAAILGANNLITLTGGKSSWPGDVTAELTLSPACLTVTTNVNVRANPSKSGSVLTTLKKDDLVASTGKTSNGWYEIVYGDKYAYMSADLLKPAT